MLSRKSIILKAESNGVLDYNWNYPLSASLFNKMSLYDVKFAEFLHDEGFRSNDEKKKKFKLINFMMLFNNQKMDSKGININKNDEIVLIISGYKDPMNAILQGLCINNEINLNNIIFKVVDIKNDRRVKFNKINIYKVMTPIVESIWENGLVKFLNPYEPEYYDAIKQNLKRKYEIIYKKPYNGELKLMIENMLKIKKKSIRIKNGYIHGYSNFEILVQCDKDMQKVAYYCGLGQNSSMGIGLLNYITGGE
ncbi:CRISPR-associated endoribonuclease Cas6 [Clostridium botulinum C]|uniref:CRISPR-associated endoribonuclease n=4 Tax=Clostridium botulinum TaxID=1491 RepID=A0A9Q4TM04_CLOBO|nr:CRISPR-associated endoribonuclease Cas6 [Clostridium botulinum]YP_398448.1 CRISPR-associated endoribonuclease Cas6 [Clostridium phage c-st]MCD3196045.1 CRISPR-associated endoribonuclease Cas6 [Clostridium botulinum C]MCD3200336.1 CRISPR-associated endoribonuclease Cas6 [Clostridium botulinum C]MCD3206869.1 CRISPR-associated endoribonuclease Cas6 [Clostridium botulinum C]MCD3207568.1 CRISPR-associated endoribonuclease Cas6 [Clostridium botulinum C]MCD3226302.1 CRISPR-associated endoribonucl